MYSITAGLQDFDHNIQTSTAMALGNIARNNKMLAESIIKVEAVPDLIGMLSGKEPALKHAAAFALDNLIKNGSELAEAVEESNAIQVLVKNVQHECHKIRSDAFQCLADMARLSPGIANKVATTPVISNTVQHLYHPDEEVQKNAAALLRDLCKHNLRFVDMVINEGGMDAFLEIIDEEYGPKTLSAIMSLGYMAAQSEELAGDIIVMFGVTRLREILQNEPKDIEEQTDVKQKKDCEEQLQVAAGWTLGQIGKHSFENVASLVEEKVLLTLFDKTIQPCASDNLKHKCRNALNLLIPKCEDWTDLEVIFLGNDSEELWPSLLYAFSKIIPCDASARRSFVSSHCLTKMMKIEEKPEYLPYMKKIYECFPDKVLNLESPTYLNYLMKTLKKFQPPTGVQCTGTPSSESTKSPESEDGVEISTNSACNTVDKSTKPPTSQQRSV
uniref:Sperm-associated antigen 6 n=1 Tax=Cacopsylla melanoneura TaxID=428564 RepID=A0A8D8X0M1_9HEMI